MFRRLINHTNLKTFGVRKMSNCNNDVILQKVRNMDSTLDFIFINTILNTIYMGLYFLSR